MEEFAHRSITTTDFKEFLYKFMKSKGADKVKILDTVKWDEWFFGHGMPPVKNQFDQSLAKACQDLAGRWQTKDDDKFGEGDIKDFSTLQRSN